MDILDMVVRFYIIIRPTLMVWVVIIWSRSQISLYDVVLWENVFQLPANPLRNT